MDNFDQFYKKMLVKVAKEQKQRDYDFWLIVIIALFTGAFGIRAIVDIMDTIK